METSMPKSAADAVAAAVAMLEDVATALATANDCGARATTLKEWAKVNGARMAAVRADMRAHTGAELQPEVQKQMKASAAVSSLFETARDCLSDAGFADAWEAVAKVMD
jgi:hypothetical protein